MLSQSLKLRQLRASWFPKVARSLARALGLPRRRLRGGGAANLALDLLAAGARDPVIAAYLEQERVVWTPRADVLDRERWQS